MMAPPVAIPADLLRQIGEYLAQRPYREVALLLSGLQEAVSAQQPPVAD